MAELTGFLAMSHGPQLMVKPDQWNVLHNDRHQHLKSRPELEKETLEDKWGKFNRCMSAIEVLRKKVEEWKPDVLVMVADDQHENILDDANPPFTVYIGGDFEASTSLGYFKEPKSANRTKYKANQKLAQGILEKLMNSGFDPAYSKELRYEGGMGHAFSRVLKFLTPGAQIPVVAIMVNTYFPPAPSAKRCVDFGKALAAAIKQSPDGSKAVVIASGGLSHTIIDEVFDNGVLDAIKKNDLGKLGEIPSETLMAGTSEIRNWFVVAAAANKPATVVDYIPAYRVPNGVGCGMGFAYWDGAK
jgi:3-O-methylgallate 3,4-dioxygenase